MKFTFTFTVFAFTLFTAFGQSKSAYSISESIPTSSRSCFPIGCLENIFLIEKLEEINAQELGAILSELQYDPGEEIRSFLSDSVGSLRRADKIIMGADYYNNFSMIKINQSIETILSSQDDITLIPIYTSDIVEPPRYIIRSKFNFEKAADPDYCMSYYIFDNVENRSYKSFHSLDRLLKSIKLSRTYIGFSQSRTQEDLDEYLKNKIKQEEKKALWKKNRGTGGVGILALMLGGLAAISFIIAIL